MTTQVDVKPLDWIVGGFELLGHVYADAFGIRGFYQIVGLGAPWTLKYPEGRRVISTVCPSQAIARGTAQDHYATLVRKELAR